MKASDIKVGYIYYVDYEPVRSGEFNGIHLSVVLKRNVDKYTFVVMPLTSSANGDGVNKLKVGKIAALPSNISHKDTYAVYNQVRTVNANRFRAVKSSGVRLSVPMDSGVMQSLYGLLIHDVLYNVSQNEKISILKKAYDNERFIKAKDIAYSILKLRKAGASEEKITALIAELKETLQGVNYVLSVAQIADGIQKIFDEAVKT